MKKILVTGSHRSGSTWVGNMLTIPDNNVYIHEPLNYSTKVRFSKFNPRYWFEMISTERMTEMDERFTKLRYPLWANLKRSGNARDLAKSVYYFWRYWRLRNSDDLNIIVKDPISIMSVERYLEQGYRVVVLQRHPAAFISSLWVKSWHFDFKHFSNQEALMATFSDDTRKRIKEASEKELNILEQGVLLWRVFSEKIIYYKDKHPDSVLLRTHEELSLSAVDSFKELYAELELEFDDETSEKMKAMNENQIVPDSQQSNSLIRDSRKNIRNWEKRLDRDQINFIQKETSDLFPLFYPNQNW